MRLWKIFFVVILQKLRGYLYQILEIGFTVEKPE